MQDPGLHADPRPPIVGLQVRATSNQDTEGMAQGSGGHEGGSLVRWKSRRKMASGLSQGATDLQPWTLCILWNIFIYNYFITHL